MAALANPAVSPRLQPGDEVIVPALSWSTTVWPLVQHGLVPVVVDIDPRTLNVDPAQVERAVGPKTRGLMIVHVYGNPCDMAALGDIVRRRDLVFIEDCCEAMGASYRGRPVGRFGRVGTFSFYYSHHITTIEGGMCVTGEDGLAEPCGSSAPTDGCAGREQERYLGAPRHPPPVPVREPGYNLRPTELQAPWARAAPKLAGFISRATPPTGTKAPRPTPTSSSEEGPRRSHSWFGFRCP